MARKTRTKKDKKIEELSEILECNAKAVSEGPRRKNFTSHDLKHIKPLNNAQTQMFELYLNGNNIIANGSAGSGKTFCAMYLALNDLLNRNHGVNNIKIVRSAVSSREIGHLPGSIAEKLEPYEAPYKDIFADLLGKFDAYEQMCAMGYVQFMPTSFVRGLTWDNSIVIIDEVQNMNFYEINSIITRIGENSKIIICGDYAQNDLHNKRYDSSGMGPFLKVARASGIFEEVIFTRDDIVRSKLVKQWICALEDMEQTEKIIPLRAA
jgi:phosphate starvation-inducible protein PhoH and related proteins